MGAVGVGWKVAQVHLVHVPETAIVVVILNIDTSRQEVTLAVVVRFANALDEFLV